MKRLSPGKRAHLLRVVRRNLMIQGAERWLKPDAFLRLLEQLRPITLGYLRNRGADT